MIRIRSRIRKGQAPEALNRSEFGVSDRGSPSRVLRVCGSARDDGTCPWEISKTWRLTTLPQEVLQAAGIATDVWDLSLVTSEYGRNLHPCKGCVSSAMPLCYWPCSCYPKPALNQADDRRACPRPAPQSAA